ncbi:MAG: hypothetical protein E2O57_03575 [Gammaproteobacteria bacterium]|nr:MAG: hypothetical protein E2O57_03575 [Gammaproteobacteria bacterium]
MDQLVALPKLVVEIDGTSLSIAEGRNLLSVRVQQGLSLPSLCELIFIDPEEEYASLGSMHIGAELRILLQEQGSLLFKGQVTALDYAYGPSNERTVHVRGYDHLHQLRKRQPVCAHVEITLEELVRSLTSDLGISVEAETSGPVWEKLLQYRQSDLEFITEQAERCGLYFTLQDETLHLISLQGLDQEPVELELGKSLLEARIVANGDPACRSVDTTAWNPWLAEEHYGHASEARSGRDIEMDILPDNLGGTGERRLVDETLQNDAQADVIAQAELDRRVAGEVILWGVADGDPGLQAGTPVVIGGVAETLAGRYVLTAVTHTIDHHKGYVSEFETAPPERHPRERSTLSTLGVVTRVDDPKELGRVKVILPSYNDIETNWLQVVIPGAGPDKGIVALCDTDDSVMVLLHRDDPAQGVVLGGLYGNTSPPDAGVNNGAIRRYNIQTPGGQRINLDDDENRVRINTGEDSFIELSPGTARLENSDGSFIELSENNLIIHATVNLEIEAPGKSIVIRGKSIDFETG